MTLIEVRLRKPASDGTDVPAAGYVDCVPTARREVGDTIVLPTAFTVPLVGGGVDIELAPTGVDWCWLIHERVANGTTRYVAVPASATPVGYEDLADVDPDTLDPTAPLTPAWQSYVDANFAQKQISLAVYTSADEAGTAAYLATLDPGTPYLITQADPFDILQGVTA